ncbi:preprotein translocase subunit SecE [Streptococcus oricebi]|uniref:Preprotein translocase subunit SecE n=1 Tax=Streptococcus oricebi TaxID=1547447 RepID=A0ABS5B546_9STRE|nr:preprotein translocase subunit SecE [Streptococcus oricebi]
MKFIRDTFKVLKDTTWPTKKQSWVDFISVLEYTAFFVVIIYVFDLLVSSGLVRLLNIF